jgi:hypothetical protein
VSVATEAKPFASLSSGLLARKGAARPAMRPQGFGQGVAGLEDLGWNDMGFEPPKPVVAPVRDADHDAFGEEIDDQPHVHPTGLTPVQSPVHGQQAEIADRMGVDEEEYDETAEPFEGGSELAPVVALAPAVQAAPRRSSKPRALPGSKGKAAFTLRLDPQRHLKLRLACAVNGRSAQQLVTDALDQLLVGMPELDAMADKAKRRG